MGNRRLNIFRVEGVSMNPLLQNGDRILIESCDSYRIGDVIACPHPIQTDIMIVKRIKSIAENGKFRLLGDNPKESSEKFGLVDPSAVVGKFVLKLDGERGPEVTCFGKENLKISRRKKIQKNSINKPR